MRKIVASYSSNLMKKIGIGHVHSCANYVVDSSKWKNTLKLTAKDIQKKQNNFAVWHVACVFCWSNIWSITNVENGLWPVMFANRLATAADKCRPYTLAKLLATHTHLNVTPIQWHFFYVFISFYSNSSSYTMQTVNKQTYLHVFCICHSIPSVTVLRLSFNLFVYCVCVCFDCWTIIRIFDGNISKKKI